MMSEVPGPLLYTNEEVLEAIKNIDQIEEEYKERYDQFYNRFCHLDDGNASKRCVERVFCFKNFSKEPSKYSFFHNNIYYICHNTNHKEKYFCLMSYILINGICANI